MVYLISMGVFSFIGYKPNLMQVFSHACLHFLDFLGHVIHFWMAGWTTFIDAYGKPINIFSSIMAHWHTFESACPKQEPSNGSNKTKLMHDMIEVKALAQAYKLDLSS
jgi:hypothetical protein